MGVRKDDLWRLPLGFLVELLGEELSQFVDIVSCTTAGVGSFSIEILFGRLLFDWFFDVGNIDLRVVPGLLNIVEMFKTFV